MVGNNKDMIKEAACVFVRDQQGRVLSVSRKGKPKAFGLPGGKVELGETLKEAAIRECKEETGLDVFDLKQIYYRVSEDDEDYNCTIFSANLKIGGDPISNTMSSVETGVIEWVHPQILFVGPFGDYIRKMFNELNLE